MVEIVPTVTRPGVLRLFGWYNYQGECQQDTMLAIIYLWPTQDSLRHPLVLQCTLEQEPSLNFPSHWSRWQNWMSTQPVQSSTTFSFTATWRPSESSLEWTHSPLAGTLIFPIPLKRRKVPQSRILEITVQFSLPWPCRRPLREPAPHVSSQEPTWS